MKKDKQIIYMMAAIFAGMFAILIGYFLYFSIFKQKEMLVHPQNTRMNILEEEVVRGEIYDTNLVLLGTTDEEGNRVYPRKALYAHAVGYSQSGKTGVEALANAQLLYPDYNIKALFKAAFLEEKFEGRDVVLTLDDRYQTAIADAMGSSKGGVVVLEPETGKIRAMYSAPSFDPNNITSNWESLTTDTNNTPLLNRATQGLYPPGSIFKVITTLAYLQNYDDIEDFSYDCDGIFEGDDFKIKCYDYTAHGHVDIHSAFAASCNGYFIKLAEKLSVKQLQAAAESLGFNTPVDFDMSTSTSKFQLTASDSTFEKAATSIGQGKTLATPMHMALIASAIANDGVSMKPYIVDYSMKQSGKVKLKNMPIHEGPIMDEETARYLQELMKGVVTSGTGSPLITTGITVGGKTGTAQNETSEDHSWFIGFAKDDAGVKTSIAFAVLVEGGGVRALSVAQKILDVYEQVKP